MRWLSGNLTSLITSPQTSSFNVAGLNLLGHSHDTDRSLFRFYLNTIVKTHDGLFEYVQKRRLSGGQDSTDCFADDWKHISSLQAEFWCKEELSRVAVVGDERGLHEHAAIFLLL